MSLRAPRLTISGRLALMTALIAALLVASGSTALLFHRRQMQDDRIQSLRAISELFQSYAGDLEKRVAAGALTKEAALSQFAETAMAMRYNGGADYISVYTMEGIAVATPDRKMLGQNRMDVETNGVRIVRSIHDRLKSADTTVFGYEYTRPGRTGMFPKVSYASQYKPWNLLLIAGTYTDDLDAAFQPVALAAGGTLLLIVLATAALAALTGRGIARPLNRLSARMRRVAEGDLASPIEETRRGDEIGTMARTVEVFREALVAKGETEAASAREADAKVRRAAQLDSLTRQFEAQVSSLTQGLAAAAGAMEATAETMTRTASRATEQSGTVASAAEETSTNVQTVAAASEEMSASIHEIAAQVSRSSAIAERAAEDARRTDGIVQGLAAGAEKVGEVVGLITGIAAQTNLLALNATIEAARAGAAGRGFAVVASEVKQLAEQTGRATETISGQIGAIQGETRAAVAAIQAISRTIDEMRAISVSVAAAMEEQGAATQEIVRNVGQAAQGTQAVTVSILAVRDGADETGAASAEVLTAAQELARYSADLGREVDTFLAGVKAA